MFRRWKGQVRTGGKVVEAERVSPRERARACQHRIQEDMMISKT